jgi:protease-4
MKNFFKMLFASTLGVIIGGLILTFLSLIIFIGVVASIGSTPTFNLQKESVLRVNLKGSITDRESPNPFGFLDGSSKDQYGLDDILSAIKKAKENEKIKGIYLESGFLSTGYANLEPIRKALLDFKESGKFIVAYGEEVNQRAYYISSVADQIFLNPQGVLDFRGLASSIQFNKGVFAKWGIEWQVYKVGTYKSAVEPFILDKMSDASREQVTSFLNDIWATLLKGISESRGIPAEQLNKYADEFIAFSNPQKLIDYKLIDDLKYGDEVEVYLKEKMGLEKDAKLNFAGVKDIQSIPDAQKKVSKDKIAILYAEGEIFEDNMPSIFASGGITPTKYVKELKKLQEDKNIKAVVFRVNSPGGSAYASDQIHHAVKALNAVKPVVVSMGTYAASGGYFISAGATKIIAEPTTITGSIGIFGLVPSGEQLAKKLGATHDGVSTNKHSNFGDDLLSIPYFGFGLVPARPFNAEESALLQAHVERGYDTFLSRCADGRGKTKEEINAIGQGRVWTGNQALGLGLVDALGGIDLALKTAAELADIKDYSVEEFPAKKDFFSQLFEESLSGAKVRVVEGFTGKEALQQKQLLEAWKNHDFCRAITEVVVN